jgi:hypothetical protein
MTGLYLRPDRFRRPRERCLPVTVALEGVTRHNEAIFCVLALLFGCADVLIRWSHCDGANRRAVQARARLLVDEPLLLRVPTLQFKRHLIALPKHSEALGRAVHRYEEPAAIDGQERDEVVDELGDPGDHDIVVIIRNPYLT